MTYHIRRSVSSRWIDDRYRNSTSLAWTVWPSGRTSVMIEVMISECFPAFQHESRSEFQRMLSAASDTCRYTGFGRAIRVLSRRDSYRLSPGYQVRQLSALRNPTLLQLKKQGPPSWSWTLFLLRCVTFLHSIWLLVTPTLIPGDFTKLYNPVDNLLLEHS